MLLSVVIRVDPAHVEAARQTGTPGYELSPIAREQILAAVQRAIDTAGIAARFPVHRNRARAAAMVPPTRREWQTLQLIGEGNTEKQIASALDISIKTVRFHRENVHRKLELSRYAVERAFLYLHETMDVCQPVAVVDVMESTVDAVREYQRNSREIVVQFIEARIGAADCIRVLDAALALAVRDLLPVDMPEIRAAIRVNTERIVTEIRRRQSEAKRKPFLVP
jgi:DNA-binding CsgD family transcriptional regulator